MSVVFKLRYFPLFYFLLQARWTTSVPATSCGTCWWSWCFTGGIRLPCSSCTSDTASRAPVGPAAKWTSVQTSCGLIHPVYNNPQLLPLSTCLWAHSAKAEGWWQFWTWWSGRTILYINAWKKCLFCINNWVLVLLGDRFHFMVGYSFIFLFF